ncbi:MAG: DUF1329 domain-containing protein [Deltaproteobacteria bacterium]|nr:DUF1329 domain-containing protein [Deltaproteobacteria bacterium]
MRTSTFLFALLALATAAPTSAARAEDTFPLAAGRIVHHADIAQLEPFLPSQFWAQRDAFLPPGMEMEIGPAFRDYAPPAVYQDATKRNRGATSLGVDDTLVGYASGAPFAEIACKDDPKAGVKSIWNFTWRWQGFGLEGDVRYTYWEKGNQRALEYRGKTFGFFLKHRPEPQFAEGNVFRREKRAAVVGLVGEAPAQAKGIRTLTYRYEASLGPRASAQPEDTWVFIPDLRRTRKVSETQRSTAFAGTDFSFDDLFSFSGLPAQYEWGCIGERVLLAPTNTKQRGYPYNEEGNFGPSGLSYATDRWEARHAIGVRLTPRDPAHPYSRKDIWLDRQTFEPLYSFAYDRKGELWKVIYHLHRWSEDDLGPEKARDWYPAWENVPEPRDLKLISEALLNVQTGTGNRIDFWNAQGSPPDLRKLRQRLDVRGLSRGH